jgi:hypothetical protein
MKSNITTAYPSQGAMREEFGINETGGPVNTVWFRIALNFIAAEADCYYSIDGTSWTHLGTSRHPLTGSSPHTLGYRFGLAAYGTAGYKGIVPHEEIGWADFDYFKVQAGYFNGTTYVTP